MRRRAVQKPVLVVQGFSSCVVRGIHLSRQISAKYIALLGIVAESLTCSGEIQCVSIVRVPGSALLCGSSLLSGHLL